MLRKIQFLLNIVFLFLCLSVSARASDLVITNVNIIDPSAQTMMPRLGYIIVHNDRIKKVGYGKLTPPTDSYIYDAKNKYVIPGLIDSHNHIDMILGMSEEQFNTYPELISEYRKQLPRSYLYFGYMTIIDVATTDQKAIQSFNESLDHPDLYTCGGGITVANGYPMNYLPKEIRFDIFPNFLIENSKDLPSHIDPKQHTPAAIIKRIVDAHGRCVKIFYESGYGADKNLPLPSLASVKELVKLAHQHHLPVLLHANNYDAQKFALASGVDILAHGLWSWGPHEGEPGLPAPIQSLLDQMIARHMGYQPTIQVINGLLALEDQNYLNDPHLENVVPAPLLDWYRTKEGEWYKNSLVEGSTHPAIKKIFMLKANQVGRVVSYLQQKKANLLFGTDTPSGPTYGNPPGYNGYLEMQNWYRAHVPLAEILRAATIKNAKFFHLDKDYGSITEGKFAHLVIMKKNPLQDISAYDSITSLVLHGQIHDRVVFLANKK